MNFHIFIPKRLEPYYREELEKYRFEISSGNLNNAWRHLERAHILGQKYPYAHTFVHWKMLSFGLKIKSGKEVFGQLPRLFFGGVKSFVGKIPVGNPGGANVSALKSFPIEKDLQDIFLKAGVNSA